jgi:hypothetical protein
MLTQKLTNCKDCNNIEKVIKEIDCIISKYAMSMYNNIIYELNQENYSCSISDLLHYKRILTYKLYNNLYACNYSFIQIVGKVRKFTAGCKSRCTSLEPVNNSTTTSSTTRN